MCAYQAKRMDVAEGGCWRILFVGLTRKNRSGNKLTIAKVIHLFIHIPDGIAHQLAHTHSQCVSYLGHQTKRRNGACSWCGPFCEAALRSSLGSTLGCMCMFRPDICFYDACESLYGALWVLATGGTPLVASLVPTYCRPTDLRITVCQHNNDTVRQGQGCPPHQKGVVVAVKGKPQTKWKTWTPLTTNNLTTNNHHRNVPSQNW